MTDMLRTGSDWLEAKRHAHATQTVVYSRGGHQVSLSATRGRSEFEMDSGDGFPVRAESVDWLVRAQDLRLDGVTITPERHDRIRETLTSGDVKVYEVMGPDETSPVCRKSDPWGMTLRIHTKQVDTEEA